MSERTPPPPAAAAAPPPAVGETRHRLQFSGRVGELFPIFLVNLVLGLVTATVYRFWGRTRVRRYLWSQAQLMEEPLEYAGNGLELFVGFIIVLFLIILPLTLVYTLADIFFIGAHPEYEPLLMMVFYPFVLFLIGVAIYRARRYRMSRTLWRSIRLAQTGSSLAYGAVYMLLTILAFITLGWFVPEKNIRLWSHLINNSYYGDERFRFERLAHRLYGWFALSWFLSVPTLGMSFAWYKAAELRFLAGATRFQDLRFEFDVSGGRLLGFVLANALLLILTLGLAVPFVQIRKARFIATNLGVVGEPRFDAISQSRAPAPGVGEGLAEAFDMGTV